MARKRKSLDQWEAEHVSNEPQTWFTRPQAAAYLSLGVSTLAKLDMEGKGPEACRPLANSVRYHRDALDSWMLKSASTEK